MSSTFCHLKFLINFASVLIFQLDHIFSFYFNIHRVQFIVSFIELQEILYLIHYKESLTNEIYIINDICKVNLVL